MQLRTSERIRRQGGRDRERVQFSLSLSLGAGACGCIRWVVSGKISDRNLLIPHQAAWTRHRPCPQLLTSTQARIARTAAATAKPNEPRTSIRRPWITATTSSWT